MTVLWKAEILHRLLRRIKTAQKSVFCSGVAPFAATTFPDSSIVVAKACTTLTSGVTHDTFRTSYSGELHGSVADGIPALERR